MVDTNVRSVKRTDQGASILTKGTANIRTLCDHCALIWHCDYRARIADIAHAAKLNAPVTTCQQYQYPIHFVDTRGLEAPGCNTMRLGTAWARRVLPGDQVGLLNSDKRLIASAQVKAVHVVPLSAAGLQEYAGKNHMLIGESLEPLEAAERLLKILRNSYGNLVYQRSTEVTIIVF